MTRSVVRYVASAPAVALILSLSACVSTSSAPPDRAADVVITNLPSPLWTVTEGVYEDAASNPPDGHASTQNLT